MPTIKICFVSFVDFVKLRNFIESSCGLSLQPRNKIILTTLNRISVLNCNDFIDYSEYLFFLEYLEYKERL
jgi:hypothetical protein